MPERVDDGDGIQHEDRGELQGARDVTCTGSYDVKRPARDALEEIAGEDRPDADTEDENQSAHGMAARYSP